MSDVIDLNHDSTWATSLGVTTTLLILGARAVLQAAERRQDRLSRWARSVRERRGYHRACVAVAAKNVRIVWALLANNAELRMVGA